MAWLIFICGAFYNGFIAPLLSTEFEIVDERLSTNEKYKAVVIFNPGNATVRSSYRVSIIKSKKKINNKDGVVFLAEGVEKVDTRWDDDANLTIEITAGLGFRTFTFDEKIENINIHYKINGEDG